MKQVIAIDIDNTLTENYSFGDYIDHPPSHWVEVMRNLKPRQDMIDYVNELASDNNNLVYIYTARDDVYESVTIEWLKKHKVNYEYVQMKKLFFHILIDDRTVTPNELVGKE